MLWVGKDTVVATMDGPKAAHELRVGERMQDAQGIYRPILALKNAKRALCMVRIRGLPAFAIDPEARAVTAKPEYCARRYVPSSVKKFMKWGDLRGGHSMEGVFVFAPIAYKGAGAVEYIDQLDYLRDFGHHNPSALWKWDNDQLWYASERKAQRIFRITPRAALFFGLFLADGTCTKKHMGAAMRVQSQVVSFAIAASQLYLARLVREQASSLYCRHAKARKVPHGACYNVHFTFRPAIQMLSQCYDIASSKVLPQKWFLWQHDLLLHVLRGWLLGDGCIKNNRVMTGVTTSPKLVFQMWWIALAAGMQATIATYVSRQGYGKAKRTRAYQLSIPGRDVLKLLAHPHVEERQRWKSFTYKPASKASNASVRVSESGAYLRVDRVEKDHNEAAVGIATRRYTSAVVNGLTTMKLVCGKLNQR